MRKWISLIIATVTLTVGICVAVVAADWVWHAAPGSSPVAAVLGDPRLRLKAPLPASPGTVPIYQTSSALTADQLRRVLPGQVTSNEGWLDWKGRSDLDPVTVMQRLNPGIPWRARDGMLGPAPTGPAFGIESGGLSGAFTGTAVTSNSFGRYIEEQGQLVYLSIPAHRIRRSGAVKVLPASVALLDLKHHRQSTRVLPVDVVLLPKRLTEAPVSHDLGPITDVRLVQMQDPQDLSKSKPVWVFDPVGEVDAER